jgi:hypothetical protein
MEGSRVRVWVAWVFTAGWLLVIGAGSGVAREAPKVSLVVPSWANAVDPRDKATPDKWLYWRREAGLLPQPEGAYEEPYSLTAAEADSASTLIDGLLTTVLGSGHGLALSQARARNVHSAPVRGDIPSSTPHFSWGVRIDVPVNGQSVGVEGVMSLTPGGLYVTGRLVEGNPGPFPARDVTLALLDWPAGSLQLAKIEEGVWADGRTWLTAPWPDREVLCPLEVSAWPQDVRAWSNGDLYFLTVVGSRVSERNMAAPFSPLQHIDGKLVMRLHGDFGKDLIESCLPRFEGFPEVWEVDLVSPDLSEPVTPEATLAAVLDGALGRSPLAGKAKAFRLFSSREWSQARPEAPPLAVRKLLGLADGFTCPTLHVRGDRVLGDVTAGLVRMQPGDDTHNGWPNRLAEARALVQWVSGDGYVALTTLNPSNALDARTPGGAPWGDSALSRNAPSEFGKTHGQYVLEGLLGQLGQGLCWLPWDVEAAGDRTHVRLTPDPEAQVGYPTRSRLGDTVWGGVQMWVDGVVTHTVIPTER